MLGLRQLFRTTLRYFPGVHVGFGRNVARPLQAIDISGIRRTFSTQLGGPPEASTEPQTNPENLTKHKVGAVDRKMRIMFTCKKCETRNSKTMSKLAYEIGVVIIRCDGCNNNHLIADNLGWFGPIESKRNIEKIMKDKGHTVTRLQVYGTGIFEVVNNEDVEDKSKESTVIEDSNRALETEPILIGGKMSDR